MNRFDEQCGCQSLLGPMAWTIQANLAIGITALLLGAAPLAAQQATKITYRSFDGETLARHATSGRKVALAVAARDTDQAVLQQALKALDAAYACYAEATGREPAERKESMWKGCTLVAEVEKTCGAGCGYLGTRGIEIMPAYLQTLLTGIATKQQYDQVLFYELGRNFWFYGDQLEYQAADAKTGSVTTGYAVFMRFVAMEAAGVEGGPFNQRPFAEFRAEVEGLVDSYERDPQWTWQTTLREAKGVPNKMSLGATDLFASFCFRLMREFGGPAYIGRLWREVGRCPAAKTTQDAVDNFVVAASLAAKRDLAPMFVAQWRWPVSAKGRERAKKAGPAVEQLGETRAK